MDRHYIAQNVSDALLFTYGAEEPEEFANEIIKYIESSNPTDDELFEKLQEMITKDINNSTK